ncbi:MAG: hypothetical protein U0350_08525 [Caldilineaceae bacterium]
MSNVAIESITPRNGQLSIHIQVSAAINVTAFTARQKVTGYVADQISTNMHGGEPTLVVGKQIYWRVPIVLSLPPLGDRGIVGNIDVDIETGQLLVTPQILTEIMQRAESLAISAAHTPA